MAIEEFRTRLVAQLPGDIPLYHLEEIELKSPAATRLLERAEYLITVATASTHNQEDWQNWINAVNNTPEICWEKTTKSGKKQIVNLCARLFDLQIHSADRLPQQKITLKYIGSCRNDGTKLSPEQVVYMLEYVAQEELQLIQVHRQQLILENKPNF